MERIPPQRAPHLYRALVYALVAAVLLGASVTVMLMSDLYLGVGVLVLFMAALVMGARSVYRHLQSQDAAREAERQEYLERLASLSKRTLLDDPPTS